MAQKVLLLSLCLLFILSANNNLLANAKVQILRSLFKTIKNIERWH